ncbi:MAG: TetR/AcrR family transcriptional regulator [Glaciimonas sp.]|nr:TetR/AcrR family transcriptional regulator [Glaciimonas sp.]
MNMRTSQKAESRQRIVEAAGYRLRESGAAGTGVVEVMADAGLTHGGFYAHFDSKEDLLKAALQEAMLSREGWVAGLDDMSHKKRLSILLERYLNPQHRDNPRDGCPVPAVAPDMIQGDAAMQAVFATEVEKSIAAVTRILKADSGSRSSAAARANAMAAISLCVGGLLLARAVGDSKLSDEILQASRQAGERAFVESGTDKGPAQTGIALDGSVKARAKRKMPKS